MEDKHGGVFSYVSFRKKRKLLKSLFLKNKRKYRN
jgi:hypothetical protein